MKQRTSWRVQAHWRVGTEQRSYDPFYVSSERKAWKAASEVTETLSHFVDLVVTVEEVDRAVADDHDREAEARRLAAPKPTLHIRPLGDAAALCGATTDAENALATAEMFALARSEKKCSRCIELAG